LSVTLLNDKVCEHHFAVSALEYGKDLDIEMGMFVVAHSRFTLSLKRWAEQNDEVKNMAKFRIFRLSRATQ